MTDNRWIVEAAEIAAERVHTGTTFILGEGTADRPMMVWDDGAYFYRLIQIHAWELLQYARIHSFGTGTEDAFTDSVRWLAEVAENYGFRHGGEPHSMPPEPEADPGLSPIYVESWPLGAWPPAPHLRLHYLADIGHGWCCRDCGMGLVDVCRDDDIVTDTNGRRLLRPGTQKRLPTRDHTVPQAMGGSHGPENLALVCGPCNSRKGAA